MNVSIVRSSDGKTREFENVESLTVESATQLIYIEIYEENQVCVSSKHWSVQATSLTV